MNIRKPICDSHVHSHFSFDASPSASPDAICERAKALGMTHIAITDHNDVNVLFDHSFPPYPEKEAAQSIAEAKKRHGGSVCLAYGVELGQAHQYPEAARAFLDVFDPDVVVGSLHSLRGEPDFYSLGKEKYTDDVFPAIWDRYLDEYLEMLGFDGIDIAAHLTYPIRYARKHGCSADISASIPKIENIFRTIVKKDICLEVNTSGFRQGMGGPLPDFHLLELYRDCGGKLVTLGSDAHAQKDIGADFDLCVRKLCRMGFEHIAFVFRKDIMLTRTNT